MKNNKGLTLIELLVTLAVMSIVMLQVVSLLINVSTLYKKGTAEVDLQSEAQHVVQIMEELIVDASISVNSIEKGVQIVNNGNEEYLIELEKEDDAEYGELYLTHKSPTVGNVKMFMADYVESISLNVVNLKSDDKINVAVVMNNGDYQYRTSAAKDIYLRNKIGTGGTDTGDSDAVGDKELIVLRYKSYNLEKEFCNKYSYAWPGSEGSNFALTSGKNIRCKDTLNHDWTVEKKDTVVASYKNDVYVNGVIEHHAGDEAFKIVIKTEKVRVAMGLEGNDYGNALWYVDGGNEGVEFISYAEVKGVSVVSTLTEGYDTAYCTLRAVAPSSPYPGGKTSASFGSFTSDMSDKTTKTNIQSIEPRFNIDGGDYFSMKLSNLYYDTDYLSNSIMMRSQGAMNPQGSAYTPKTFYENGGRYVADIELVYDEGDSVHEKSIKLTAYFCSCGGTDSNTQTPISEIDTWK